MENCIYVHMLLLLLLFVIKIITAPTPATVFSPCHHLANDTESESASVFIYCPTNREMCLPQPSKDSNITKKNKKKQ